MLLVNSKLTHFSSSNPQLPYWTRFCGLVLRVCFPPTQCLNVVFNMNKNNAVDYTVFAVHFCNLDEDLLIFLSQQQWMFFVERKGRKNLLLGRLWSIVISGHIWPNDNFHWHCTDMHFRVKYIFFILWCITSGRKSFQQHTTCIFNLNHQQHAHLHTSSRVCVCETASLKQGVLSMAMCRSGSELVGLLEQYVHMHGQAETHIHSHTHLNREAENECKSYI